jgi:sporulation protein YlmC with PRC-barrel domain
VASAGGSSNFIIDQADNQYLASNLMGKDVQDASGNKVGSVKDVLFDDQGKMAAVVIGMGGFLGIGEKSVAISFDQVKPSKDASGNVMLTASLDKDTINSAPSFLTLNDQKAQSGPSGSGPAAPSGPGGPSSAQ